MNSFDGKARSDPEMNFLPLVELELRQLSRRPLTFRLRMASGFVAGLTSLAILAIAIGMGKDATQMGRWLFTFLSLMAFALSLLAGPILTADCLSEEKRNGTLGLLFLANLRSDQIVAGKLVGLAMPAIFALLAIVPVLGITFFLGGLTGAELIRVALVLVNTLIFSLSASLLASAIFKEGTQSLAAGSFLMLAMSIGLPAIGYALSAAKAQPAIEFLLFSPVYTLRLAPESGFQGNGLYFWLSLGTIFLTSFGFLVIACLVLPFTWQDKPARSGIGSWLDRLRVKLTKEKGGGGRDRHLLDVSPILWLAHRRHGGKLGIWLFLLVS
ncbi:ABC transporter permease, partial [Pedosphaera parvula]